MRLKLFLGLFFVVISINAQEIKSNRLYNEANIEKYLKENAVLNVGDVNDKVVLIGNSITEGWYNCNKAFFETNNIICRGISGQVSGQMLLRFQQDVIDLKPSIVVINAGVNDIAENGGKYNENFTFSCIKSMAEIADANNITVVLTSVLPAKSFRWNKSINDSVDKINSLNKKILSYAKQKGYVYLDYYSKMVDEEGGLPEKYSSDGVHPTPDGYQVMERLLLPLIDKLRMDNL